MASQVVRLTRNSSSTNADQEESLVEIEDEEYSSKSMFAELKGQKKILNWLKFVIGILLFLVFTSFLFGYFIHQNESVTTHENFKKIFAYFNDTEMKMAKLETADRDSIQIANHLKSRQDLLEEKIDRSKNVTHKHFQMIEEKWNEMHEVIDTLNKANATQPLSIADYISQSFVYDLNITNIQRRRLMYHDAYAYAFQTIYSEDFNIWSGVRVRLKLVLDAYSVTMSLQLMEHVNTTSTLSTEKIPKITYIFNNVEVYSKANTAIGHCKFNQTFTPNQTVYDTEQYSDFLTSSNINDIMSFKIVIEPPQLFTNYFSNNGILFWRIDNFKKQKQLLLDDKIAVLESPYFYTSPRGYKAQILLKLRYRIMEISVVIYCGEYDYSLPSTASRKIRITMFNQENPTQNLEIHEESNLNVKFLIPKGDHWITLADSAFLNGFLQNDSLLFKFIIELLPAIN